MATIPVIRVYLSLQAPADSVEADAIAKVRYTMPEGQYGIKERHWQSRAFEKRTPSVCADIGFELQSYNAELFERSLSQLFFILEENIAVIRNLASATNVTSLFVVNINSMNAEQRPYFFVNVDQVEILASLKASINFDGYLMFDAE